MGSPRAQLHVLPSFSFFSQSEETQTFLSSLAFPGVLLPRAGWRRFSHRRWTTFVQYASTQTGLVDIQIGEQEISKYVCFPSLKILLYAVPCYFKETLKSYARNFLIIRNDAGFEFDLYINEFEGRTLLGGAYWRDFANTMNLCAGDSVHFSAVGYGCLFNAKVYDENNDTKVLA
ncbi:uncharacterized protein LOC104581577 [Brachypodium distachyon]|uniref:uncharacterized protein LOC104581577 n=1 Tax=Brachypodium distachyon TaxID=15368 RepID=UPI000D0D788B|nr:uncharacterized protein LOC104581577 [Brachypodium distachyon]|eukprot:XP_024317038.1 uncharacterized protein LOC104581577 [Brachypodium distachyon]